MTYFLRSHVPSPTPVFLFVRLLAAAAIGFTPTTAQSQELWKGIAHGMTLEEAQAAYDTAERMDPPVELAGDLSRQLLLKDVGPDGIQGEGFVIFRNNRVSRVQLNWDAEDGRKAAVSKALESAAIGWFGQPFTSRTGYYGRSLSWRNGPLAITYSPPSTVGGAIMTIQHQNQVHNVPLALEDRLSKTNLVTVEAFSDANPDAQAATYSEILSLIEAYYQEGEGASPEALYCMNSLSNKTHESKANQLAGLFSDAATAALEDRLNLQPVIHAFFLGLDETCNPLGQRWQTKKRMKSMRRSIDADYLEDVYSSIYGNK